MAEINSSLARQRNKGANLARRLADVKHCSGCQQVKAKSQFGPAKDRPDGLRGVCRPCHAVSNAQWRARNLKLSREASDRWKKNNPERVKGIKRRFLDRHPGYFAERQNAWRKRHPERASETAKRSRAKAYKTIQGNLNTKLGNSIRSCLSSGKGGRATFKVLDFSRTELKLHIERQFSRSMSWEKFIAGQIHIDHIIPLASFTFHSVECEGFKRAWALTNLRPLWAKDNLRKSAKILFLI